MATITAALTVNSDITDYGMSISNTMTMSKAGATTGLNRTSGLQRKYLTDKKHVDLLVGGSGTVEDMTLTASAKVYIKYLEADTSKYVTIGFGLAGGGTPTPNKSVDVESFELGRLYGNEWMIIPCGAKADDGDIVAYPSVATTADEAIVEYIVFFE